MVLGEFYGTFSAIAFTVIALWMFDDGAGGLPTAAPASDQIGRFMSGFSASPHSHSSVGRLQVLQATRPASFR